MGFKSCEQTSPNEAVLWGEISFLFIQFIKKLEIENLMLHKVPFKGAKRTNKN